MKKKMLVLFVLLLLPFITLAEEEKKDTTLSNKNLIVECIYSDGGLYSYEYNEAEDKFVTNRQEFLGVGKKVVPSNIVFLSELTSNNESLTVVDKDLTCKRYIYSGVSRREDEEAKKDNIKNIYMFVKGSNSSEDFMKVYEANIDSYTGKWYTIGIPVFKTEIRTALETAVVEQKRYELVNQRYRILDSSNIQPKKVCHFESSSKKDTVSTRKDIITANIYSNHTFIKTSDDYYNLLGKEESKIINDICNNREDDSKVYLNDSVVSATGDSSGGVKIAPKTYDNKKQTYLTVAQKESKVNFLEYKKISENNMLGKETDDKLCETIPNVAKILREVIKFGRLGIGAIVIILIAIDILHFVSSISPAEQLPITIKKIRNRIILLVVILLLPILTSVLVTLLKSANTIETSTIQVIDCLFK